MQTLKNNPFYLQIIQTFITDAKAIPSNKGISFNDYLDLMNAFSSKLDFESKRNWMFLVLKKLDVENLSENYLSKKCLFEYLCKIMPDEKIVTAQVEQENGIENHENIQKMAVDMGMELITQNPVNLSGVLEENQMQQRSQNSEFFNILIRQIVEEAIENDIELNEDEKTDQLKNLYLSKSQFDHILDKCKENFMNNCVIEVI